MKKRPRNYLPALAGLAFTTLSIGAAAQAPSPGPAPLPAADARQKIPVTLFGQPCFLQGPLDPKILRSIHAVSPEQIVTPFGPGRTRDQTKQSIDKLDKTAGLPPLLDRYHERMGRQLRAQLAFLEGLDNARKTGKPDAIRTAAKPHLRPGRLKDFEGVVAKLPQTGAEPVFEAFADSTDSDAEEEFHRAIRKLNVQYNCNFDVEDAASSDGTASDEEEPEPKPALKSTTAKGKKKGPAR